MDKDTTVLEFYCGIGGLHCAYCMCGGCGKVVPYDISKNNNQKDKKKSIYFLLFQTTLPPRFTSTTSRTRK